MVLFFMVAGVLAYTWVVYPVLVLWFGRRRSTAGLTGAPPCVAAAVPGGAVPGRAIVPTDRADEDIRPTSRAELPSLAIVLSAHNEEAVIEARLANLAALDYPVDRLRVWVGVDGATDRTAQLAQAWAASHPNVTVVVAERNHGKMAMLKRLVAEEGARGEGRESQKPFAGGRASILVFTDANTMFETGALRRLVECFADPKIGGVCGRLVLEHGAAGKTDERSYWDMESRIKDAESQLDSCLGANGAIYAIRACLFPADLPDNIIIDDFVVGMKVREQGFRMVFEPLAIAREELPPAVSDEWKRRVRIGSGAYQSLLLCWRCLSPAKGAFAWAFWSHKVLRWFTPHVLILALLLACALGVRWVEGSGGRSQGAGFRVQAGWWASAVVVILVGLWVFRRAKLLRLASYFLAMQAALFVGFLRFCGGNLSGTWARTDRTGSGCNPAGEGRPTPRFADPSKEGRPTPACGHPSREGKPTPAEFRETPDQRNSPPRRG